MHFCDTYVFPEIIIGSTDVNDWEKIYDLPPHSSTIVGKDVPTNIDVKRRLSQFQGSVQSLQRRQESAHRSYSMDGVSSSLYFEVRL